MAWLRFLASPSSVGELAHIPMARRLFFVDLQTQGMSRLALRSVESYSEADIVRVYVSGATCGQRPAFFVRSHPGEQAKDRVSCPCTGNNRSVHAEAH